MWPEPWIDPLIHQRRRLGGEVDPAAAADAVAERAQSVGGCRAVPGEAAALATGRRLSAIGQRAFKVPSPSSSAFEVLWAAGSVDASVLPGDAAYGKVEPPPSGKM
jgi:hypothetical protein